MAERGRNDRAEARRLVEECRTRPADARLWLRTALLLDSLGREATAVPHYQHALELGLAPDDERTALICLASSHRNLKHPDEALAVLRRARRRFPGDAAVEACYALALLDSEDARGAVRTLGLALVTAAGDTGLGGFEQALLTKFRGVTRRSGPVPDPQARHRS
jgi:tetratricopeptide (TPR) repeat protein